IGLVGMSRRATRFRIAWRNARQRAARYRARLAAAEARVTELEQALADADATQLHTDGACEAVQRAETAEAAIDGALPDLRRAIDSMPTTCRYHGDRLDPDQYGRMVRSEACCDTGVAPRRAREARRAIDRLAALDEPTQQPTDTTQEQP
ncbi:hypothetical protein, partial [Streptomyces fradiae]